MTQKQTVLVGVAVVSFVIVAGMSQRALGQAAAAPGAKQAGRVPTFEKDLTWPPQLPNNWVMASVSSVAVDRRDHVWVLHRPRTVADDKKGRAAPPVLEFDAAGKFVQAWGGPADGYEWPDNEHGIFVDEKDHVWVGGNAGTGTPVIKPPWRDDDMLLRFTTKGKFVSQFGRRNQSGGNKDTKNLKEPADLGLYRKTNEVFVADGYGNRRVIVLDADTGAFKRMWGAFGNTPLESPPPPAPGTAAPAPVPETEPQFGVVHSIKVSNDGLVYVGDRANRRVQVFTIAGKYVSQAVIDPAGSAASAVALSSDPQQQFIYAADAPHSRIVVVNRKTLQVVGEFARNKGSLSVHHMAVDSKGNLYTAELNSGTQKFVFKGMSSGSTQ